VPLSSFFVESDGRPLGRWPQMRCWKNYASRDDVWVFFVSVAAVFHRDPSSDSNSSERGSPVETFGHAMKMSAKCGEMNSNVRHCCLERF